MQNEASKSDKELKPSVIGAWHAQVTFSTDHPGVPERLRGHTENLTLLFIPGGILFASGPIATTAGGEWHQIDERTYAFLLAEFVFEPGMPAGRLGRIVVHKDAVIRLEEDGNSFTLLEASLQVAPYDTTTGQLAQKFEVTYHHDEPNPIERVRGWRISRNWQVPNSVPPQPTNG